MVFKFAHHVFSINWGLMGTCSYQVFSLVAQSCVLLQQHCNFHSRRKRAGHANVGMTSHSCKRKVAIVLSVEPKFYGSGRNIPVNIQGALLVGSVGRCCHCFSQEQCCASDCFCSEQPECHMRDFYIGLSSMVLS